MSFQTFHFLVFLTLVVFTIWLCGGRPSARTKILLAANAYFYACWDWRFLLLLWGMGFSCFYFGKRIGDASGDKVRRRWLWTSIFICLGVLGAFKYFEFFVPALIGVMKNMGLRVDSGLLSIVLPLGISYFTFQGISYLVDIYRGQQKPHDSLAEFMAYFTFFATVSSGPIARARDVIPQLRSFALQDGDGSKEGLALILRGLSKKILFADPLALSFVAPAFDNPTAHAPWFLMVALYAYTFQIYMDLSAYTDVARGAAALCGIRLPENFNRPYVASTVSNFWQRWHMSMSSFFRDYLFIGLGGSRRGNVYANIVITFVAIGLWHGAGWNFVIYGLLHGSVVCFERYLRQRRQRLNISEPVFTGYRWLIGLLVTFHFVVFTRILFRASDIESAQAYLLAMFNGHGSAAPVQALPLALLVVAAVLHWGFPRAGRYFVQIYSHCSPLVQALAAVLAIYTFAALAGSSSSFVYMRF